MAISDRVGTEIMTDYMQSLMNTIQGGENPLVPTRLSDSVLMFLHRTDVNERLLGDEPATYDKPYYALCFEMVTDDERLYESIAGAAFDLAKQLDREADGLAWRTQADQSAEAGQNSQA
jgi:hypothetical protein